MPTGSRRWFERNAAILAAQCRLEAGATLHIRTLPNSGSPAGRKKWSPFARFFLPAGKRRRILLTGLLGSGLAWGWGWNAALSPGPPEERTNAQTDAENPGNHPAQEEVPWSWRGMWVLNSMGELRSPWKPNAVRAYIADGLKMPKFAGDVDDNKCT